MMASITTPADLKTPGLGYFTDLTSDACITNKGTKMTNQPMILTSREHGECEARWARYKRESGANIPLLYRLFDLAERSVEAFADEMPGWIGAGELFEAVYGSYAPIDTLLEALHFPPDSPLVNRSRYVEQVYDLILEHERHGSDDLYMPRSVVLGWIVQQHDTVLRMVEEGDE